MSRPSVYPKKFLTEADEAWHSPQRFDRIFCSIYGQTTAPNGRNIELKRFFKWTPDMDPGPPHRPRMTEEACKKESKARESVYVHALHEVCKRRDGGQRFYGCELTIYAPRMDPIKVILEERNFLKCFVSTETGLVIVTELSERCKDCGEKFSEPCHQYCGPRE